MERIDVHNVPDSKVDAEIAIHFARYTIVKNIVKGKKVLDVACGEGYGCYMIEQAGASHITGVDCSPEAIQKAKQSFNSKKSKFLCQDVANLDMSLKTEKFDVIVSLETIEHIEAPISFLQSIKKLATPDGVIIISYPNDYCYYPDEKQSNPYHLRKYTLEEFQDMTISVLGESVCWYLGSAITGYRLAPLDKFNYGQTLPQSWMNYCDVPNSYLVNSNNQEVSKDNCSYFVGVWNYLEKKNNGAEFFSLPMDFALEEEVRNKRHFALRLQAILAENKLLKTQISNFVSENKLLKMENNTLRFGYDRYIKIRRIIPTRIRTVIMPIVKYIHCYVFVSKR